MQLTKPHSKLSQELETCMDGIYIDSQAISNHVGVIRNQIPVLQDGVDKLQLGVDGFQRDKDRQKH